MESNIDLAYFMESGQFSDLTLMIQDLDGNSVEMNVHKIIICLRSKMLCRMLMSNFREANERTCKITISNAHIAYDIIASFYNKDTYYYAFNKQTRYEQWYYYLMWIMCCDYLEVEEFTSKLLENIEVPEQGFELLVHVISTLDLTLEIKSKIISNNLPKSYDLAKLPQDLVNVMSDFSKIKVFVVIDNGNICIYDYNDQDCIKTIETYFEPKLITKLYDHHVVVADSTGEILIYDLYSENIVAKLDDHNEGADTLSVSPDNQYIIVGKGKYIHIFETSTMKLKSIIKTKTIKIMACSSKYIAAGNKTGTVCIWDIHSTELLNEIKYVDDLHKINTIRFSPDEEKLLYCHNNGLTRIINLKTGETSTRFPFKDSQMFYLDFSSDSKCVYFYQCQNFYRQVLNLSTDNSPGKNNEIKYKLIKSIEFNFKVRQKSIDNRETKNFNIKDHFIKTIYFTNETIRNYVNDTSKIQ
ncbi:putative BTB/POZ domain and WD-repeat protein [Cotonvirus japonicus]|uniref:BTB/POZ domain and WD-repeat protein n=1 Tax=Cotonvirus japonicus TaxID=2811091 RepID=A0ABM7NSK7_9VIRU|nr:putative BTB/POZ domain and WD-repeat protein [Cotonvirus japonicus]BCS83129.1 putative BTB/POZ domain and WD-repeat protein [Cotonvirus japonicus]